MSRVLITGASTGFGRRAAERLAERGHEVVAAMRRTRAQNRHHARALQDEAGRRGWRLEVIDLDVADARSVERAVSRTLCRGPVEVLVNNAGVWGPGVWEAFTDAQWREVFEANLFGSVRVARALLPSMRARRSGFVLQVSSLQGRFVLPYSGPYVASKHAVEGAFDTLRYELRPFGIDVTLLQPFDFLTEMKAKARGYAAADQVRADAYGVSAFIEQAYLTPDPARAGDPERVVDEIVRLVEAPPGRPGRVTVANPLPEIEEINALSDRMHAGLFPMIGLGALVGGDARPLAAE